MNKLLSVLIKPASALCNLKCKYCFYMDESKNRAVPSHSVMKLEYVDILVDRIVEYLDGSGIANISFQGGEPTVAGIEYFKYFIQKMKQYSNIETHYSIQTNATLLDDEFVKLFKENNFLVGVSLDGYKENMDSFRIGPNIDSVYEKVLKSIDLLKEASVDFNILTVIARQLSKHPRQLFDFYLSNNYEYVQLIPCLPSFSKQDDGISLRPEDYVSFYKEFFKQWINAYKKGNYININLFENLSGMIQGYYPYQCGMLGRCISQFVIESNGDVYPCDFYCLDKYLMGNIKNKTFEELKISAGAKELLKTSNCEKTICQTCQFRNICHGGCQRQNVCYLKDDYCAYQELLDLAVPELIKLMKGNKN